MSRPSLFILVVLIASAAVAGVFALARTSIATGGGGSATPATSPQISYRLKQLDRLEATLRTKLAQASEPPARPKQVAAAALSSAAPAQPATIYVRRPGVTVVAGSHTHDDGEESEHESGERDD